VLYLIQQIWIWIVIAALIGFLFGWLLRWRVTLERVDRIEDNLMLVRAARDRLEQDNKRLTLRLAALEGAGAVTAAKPAVTPLPAAGSNGNAVKPPVVTAPRPSGPDDLKRISGIERETEERLRQLGVYHFDQIAAWTKANVEWVDTFLDGKGRVTREGWVEQAGRLALGEKTDFGRMQDDAKISTASSRGGGR
jgi:predicted flap endonuclease-1-like 5' DNA nuclease